MIRIKKKTDEELKNNGGGYTIILIFSFAMILSLFYDIITKFGADGFLYSIGVIFFYIMFIDFYKSIDKIIKEIKRREKTTNEHEYKKCGYKQKNNQ